MNHQDIFKIDNHKSSISNESSRFLSNHRYYGIIERISGNKWMKQAKDDTIDG